MRLRAAQHLVSHSLCIDSLTHSCNTCLLSTYYALSTGLSHGDIMASQAVPAVTEHLVLWGTEKSQRAITMLCGKFHNRCERRRLRAQKGRAQPLPAGQDVLSGQR